MINIRKKEQCSGCGACAQICPQKCISLFPDSEGYVYPIVDADNCCDCQLCEHICPVINTDVSRIPLEVYALYNKEKSVREKSASGGVFTIVAQKIIEQGGVVFAVRFDDDWKAVFDYTSDINELDRFRGSKYMQAYVGDIFNKVDCYLKNNKLVLFVGTPCQVAGLRHYLRRDYDNLILMDLICEGVPSPKIWEQYLMEELSRQKRILLNGRNEDDWKITIKNISFRNKKFGWKKFCLSMDLEINKRNQISQPTICTVTIPNSAYMQAMFKYLDLRPICYECPFKSCKSQSDITIADYWGINYLHPEMDDDMGTSMVYLNTNKGVNFFPISKTKYLSTNYEEAFIYNNIITSSKKNKYRDVFFKKAQYNKNVTKLLIYYTDPPFLKFERMIKAIIKKCIPNYIYNRMRMIWNRK